MERLVKTWHGVHFGGLEVSSELFQQFINYLQVSKRAGHAVGVGSANQLASHVHPNLVESAALTCKAVKVFGAAVEAVLIKHGEQLLISLSWSPGKTVLQAKTSSMSSSY